MANWLFSSSRLNKAQNTKSVVKGHRRKGKKKHKRRCQAAPVVVGGSEGQQWEWRHAEPQDEAD